MPEAGWYDDPEDSTQLRWWDGSRWTERRQPSETPPPAPPGSSSTASGASETPSVWDTAASATSDWGASDASNWRSGTTGAAGAAGAAGAFGVPTGATSTGAAPPRTFIEAVKVCLTKYIDGTGRASRSEYWYFALFAFVVDILTGGIAVILLLIPSITVAVRRLHDIGKSAWALLWALVPLVGLIVLIVYAVRPGEPHTNAYG